MVRGFYNLTSAMLTQGRHLDVVSQNIVNTSTAGYKEDNYHHVAFEGYMLDRIGNTHTTPGEEVGETYFKIVSSEVTTNFDQGVLENTNLALDFALSGEGFFAVQWDWAENDYNTVRPVTIYDEEGNPIVDEVLEEEVEVLEEEALEYEEEGNLITPMETIVSYTRSGQFSLDNEGYLFLPYFGRVLDPNGNEIYLGTDQITCDRFGVITHKYTGEELGQLGVFLFEDETQLERDPRGMFISPVEPELAENFEIYHGYVERSNTDLMSQMVKMIESQRALQSAATVAKIYDEVIKKAVNDIGRG